MRRKNPSRVVPALVRAGVVLAAANMVSPGALAEVRLTGLEGALLDNALIHLSLDEEPCDAPEWRVRERFARASAEIGSALEAFGFYAFEVAEQLELGEACWRASFDIDVGEPVRLRAVDVDVRGTAAGDPGFAQLITDSGLTAGEPLRHGDYEQLKRRLVELAQRMGYVEAVYESSRIDVYPEAGVADVVLHLDSGPRYTFGEIVFNQELLEPALLDRYYEFRRGDPYDRQRLTELYVELTGSGYFSAVDVRPQLADREAKEIPVLVTLAGLRRFAISYGLGFSTDTGPRFRFGRANRRVNQSGAQSGINGQLSPVISEIGYNYRFPYGDPRSEWISLDAGIKHEDTDTATSDTLELGARRVIRRRAGWQETRFIDLMIEDFVVAETRSRARLLTPGISWLKVEADDALRPAHGYRLGLELSGANDSLGSDTTFVQVDATAKWIHSFENQSRLLLRGRLGFTSGRNFVELPPSVRFFAGGDNSIRGYEFESLGPVDANGDVIGGERIAVASVEYDFPLSASWSGAVFVDAGNAFTGSDFEAKKGAGLGLRWQSPVGPIRFDIAWPVDDPVEHGARLHVSLGADL
jgi:translocation and assembly module TamA